MNTDAHCTEICHIMILAASAQLSRGFTSLHWCLAPGFVQNLMHIVSLTCRAVLEKGQKCKKSIDP